MPAARRRAAADVRRRPLAVITGASAGIGRELARQFAAGGHDLVIVARRRDRLVELKRELERRHGVRVRVQPADLYDPQGPARLHAALRRSAPDVLVLNAGTLEVGSFLEVGLDRAMQMVDLNVVALVKLARLFLPGMVARGHGRLLNLASIAAFQPVPDMAVYAATKSFVLSLSESLCEELRDTGVTVTAMCPGLTESEMADAVVTKRPVLRRVRKFLLDDTVAVAREGYEACMRGDPVVITGVPSKVVEALLGLQPRWVRRRLAGIALRLAR
jgi:hypothetical protein